jgi:hypothetical protein
MPCFVESGGGSCFLVLCTIYPHSSTFARILTTPTLYEMIQVMTVMMAFYSGYFDTVSCFLIHFFCILFKYTFI